MKKFDVLRTSKYHPELRYMVTWTIEWDGEYILLKDHEDSTVIKANLAELATKPLDIKSY